MLMMFNGQKLKLKNLLILSLLKASTGRRLEGRNTIQTIIYHDNLLRR
jgi:hypothetical protein